MLFSSDDPQTRKQVKLTALVIVLIMVTFVSMFYWRILQPRALTQQEMLANGLVVFEQPREFDSFEFIDHTGQPFTQEDLLGKWTMLFPGFTFCPDICPITLSLLAETVEILDPRPAENLQVVMMSVDPHRDTPERLGQYMPFFNPDFIGITTDIGSTLWVAQQLNISMSVVNTEEVDDFYTIDHSGNIILINPRGHYAGYFKPPFDPGRIKLTYQSYWIQY